MRINVPETASILQDSVKQEAPDASASESMSLDSCNDLYIELQSEM